MIIIQKRLILKYLRVKAKPIWFFFSVSFDNINDNICICITEEHHNCATRKLFRFDSLYLEILASLQ